MSEECKSCNKYGQIKVLPTDEGTCWAEGCTCPEVVKAKAIYKEIKEYSDEVIIQKNDEIERLKQMVKSITGGLDEAIEINQYLEKVIDEIKELNNGQAQKLDEIEQTAGQWEGNYFDLKNKLAIYEKALQSACNNLENKGTWITPGGNSLEQTFLKQAEWEIKNGQ